MLRKHSIDRRRFLGLSSAMGVAAILAACSAPAAPTPAPAAGAPAKPAEKPTEAPKPAAASQPAAPTAAPAAAQPAAAQPAAPTAAAKPSAKPGALPKSYVLNTIPAQLSEASALAQLVKDGKLPPLKERLPAEPVVVDRKGKYGGIMRSATNTKELFPWVPVKYGGGMQGTPLRLSPDLGSWVPNTLKGVEVSKDFKVMSFSMRPGMKWSDGKPHTAEDWKFWYEDVLTNKEVTPLPAQYFQVGGKMMNFVKVDDYAFRFEFAAANPSFPLVSMAHVFGLWQ